MVSGTAKELNIQTKKEGAKADKCCLVQLPAKVFSGLLFLLSQLCKGLIELINWTNRYTAML